VNCPDARLRDPARAAQLAAELTEGAPPAKAWLVLGVARYRGGDWPGARQALEKSVSTRFGGDSAEMFFLAMTWWRLGDKEKAKEWYAKGVAWMDSHNPRDDEPRRFRAEAAELLGVEQKKD
jgi:uncharacterized protein HemY